MTTTMTTVLSKRLRPFFVLFVLRMSLIMHGDHKSSSTTGAFVVTSVSKHHPSANARRDKRAYKFLGSSHHKHHHIIFYRHDKNRLDLSSSCLFSVSSTSSTPTSKSQNDIVADHNVGLYRPIADIVWKKLLDTTWVEESKIEQQYQTNIAPAKGMNGYVVKMITRALQRREDSSSKAQASPVPSPPVSYARMALLETLPNPANSTTPDDTDTTTIHTDGIQVLNIVIFPAKTTTLPVWGADFVSLPGNKHLLLLDAQPMSNDTSYEPYFHHWYSSEGHDIAKRFVWGGTMPEQVQSFISQYALWTRWGNAASEGQEQKEPEMDIPSRIQGPLTNAVQDHLEVYLKLLFDYHTNATASIRKDDDDSDNVNNSGNNNVDNLKGYIQYRLENDPARPMLKSLYGEEWTENVLSQVLFPQ